MKQIAILGSTGSIGTQALQVIEEHPDQYEAYVLTANNRVEELIAQARKFKPEAVVIANESKYTQLKEALADLPIKVYAGADALCQIVTENPIDMVLTAMVGYAGLKPTMNAIRARKPIALANKETLVVAGELINDLARFSGVPILPVDSEHSAVFQCLAGEIGNQIEKVILTASGGPFRTCTMEQLTTVTKAQALKHPNCNGPHRGSANISRYRYTSSFSTISSAAAWMLFISPTHFIWFSAFRLSFTPSCFAICAVSVSIISFA